MPKKQLTNEQWYTEEYGFFGSGYFKEYADFITSEKTMEEVNFLEKTLKLKHGTKILDLACGHGRHTIELACRGYNMTGQDINSFFLKEAKKAAKRAGVEVRWVKSDMRKIPFKNEFDVVINLFTAFGYLESDADDQQVILQIAGAIKPGGRFVLDMINRERIMRVYREKDWIKLADGSAVIMERKFDLTTGRNYEKRLRIWKDGRREEFLLSLRMYTLTELISMCKKAGLKFREVYGDYNGEALGLDSKRYILITEKK